MATLPDKFKATKGDYFWVYPESLTRVTDKSHPLYDKRVEYSFDEAWVLAAMNGGMPDPLFCQREGENLLIAEGRQRHAATVEANKRLKKAGRELIKVPVIVKKGDEAFMLGLMISSNMLRKENTIADNADLAQRYLATGKSRKEASIVFGVSDQTIANWQDYLELAPATKKAIDDGVLSATAAGQLRKLSAEDQKAKVAELKALKEAGGKPTVAAARNVAAGKPAESKPKPSSKQITALLKHEDVPGEFIAFIKWVTGDSERAEAEEVLPWMKAPEVEEDEPGEKKLLTGKRAKVK